MDSLQQQITILQTNLDQEFKLLICKTLVSVTSIFFLFFKLFPCLAFWIIFMQCGFALLEAGSVRSKNTTNILFKNLLDVFVGALSYWGFGYGFSYGNPGNAFIGHHNFFASYVDRSNLESPRNISIPTTTDSSVGTKTAEEYYASWMFQFAFAATASTIVSGAMAERTQFCAYLLYSFIITGFVFPVIAHWCWSESGFLHTGAGLNLTVIDFAGSGVVHLTGGTAAFIGAKLLGPRIGRFPQSDDTSEGIDRQSKLQGHSVPLVCMGGFILFTGFLAFNGGSQMSISKLGDGVAFSLAATNTILAGASASLSAMITNIVFNHFSGKESYWSLLVAVNGGLIGMVSTCACSNQIYPWAAFLLGTVAGINLNFYDRVLIKLKIDDPLGAVSVHLGGGLLGLLTAPIFAIDGMRVDGHFVGGIIYGGHQMAFASFGWNLFAACCIVLWTGLNCFVMFYVLSLVGLLRVTPIEETVGLDIKKHGEPAYPETYHLMSDSTESEPPFSVRTMNRSPRPGCSHRNSEVVFTVESPEARTD